MPVGQTSLRLSGFGSSKTPVGDASRGKLGNSALELSPTWRAALIRWPVLQPSPRQTAFKVAKPLECFVVGWNLWLNHDLRNVVDYDYPAPSTTEATWHLMIRWRLPTLISVSLSIGGLRALI